ncbi:hypothetical protein Y5W_03277 [Alcanivorax sp. 521-1]|uniref:Methyltransferase type 11 domain-containing protein n=1 Tax=Alloalcanivorax profundimaris TaxID=2735259 RepID=A0ABS0AV44_9GAMM|nr:class I SAM-dependent methyltransferase [Alloalcanivorax profundimaris]MBF5057983.1 hypothetical protein [Alloalcanivorax profundimaris]
MGFYSERIFPPLLDRATRPLYRDRQRLIGRARGRVLEIGVGNGANLPLYGDAATEIHGLEPEAGLLERAGRARAQAPAPERFHLLQGDAHHLPYPDGHFDTVVACLVLCTIPDPARAAREMRRVLADHGELLVLEHVASHRPRVHRWQRRLNPVWRHLACGCQLDRPTADTLAAAGFDLTDTRVFDHPKIPGLIQEFLEGTAKPR